MTMRNLLDLVSKEKRKRERVKATQKLVAGMGLVAAAGVTTGMLFAPKSGKEIRKDFKKMAANTVESIKDTVQRKAESVKDSATYAAQEVSNVIKEVHGKTEAVKKDVKDGYDEITQDIHKTVENISNELNKSVK